MAARIKGNLYHKGAELHVGSSHLHDNVMLTFGREDSAETERFNVKEVLEAIYEACPEYAPDGWKPTPEWADARVIEGTDNDGDRRLLVRSYLPSAEDRWVTDTGTGWSQITAERELTDVRILVGADDD